MSLTDLKVSEEAGKEFHYHNEKISETVWKTIFEHSPIGFALWDRELKYVRINHALAKMNDFPEESYTSKLAREDINLISEESLSLMQKVIASGEALIGREITRSLPNNPSDLRTWLVSYHPFFEDKKIEGVLASCEDITERKKVETENLRILDELRYREAKFDSLILATATTYWSADAEGEMIDDVPMWDKLTGQSTADMQNLGWQAVIHPDDVETTTQKWLTALKEKNLYETEFRLKMKNGEYRYFLSRALPLLDMNGEVREWVGVNVDIQNQKNSDFKLVEAAIEREDLLRREQLARKEAEEANRLKDDFLATLSHELRTPLTAILGWVKMLRAGQLDESDIPHALETIERNTEIQNQLIEDLLDVSRIIAGKILLEIRPVQMSTIIETALTSILPSAEVKGVQVISHIQANSSKISVDPRRIQQILWNLLSNAVKFTPQGGEINVSLSEQDNWLEISIKDNGIGIENEILTKIFERFRQADTTKTRQHGGLGLGLAIVRHLTEAHGGTIEATSEGEGMGSTFTLRLPIAPQKQAAIPTAELPKIIGADKLRLDGIRLLVVDDDEDNRDLLKTLLSHYGAIVTVASSAMEAMSLLLDSPPDILISDIGMPDEDGYQFIMKVRKLSKEKGGNTPAIALTAFAKIEDREKALSVGFQRHIAKPIDPTAFVKVIAEMALDIGG
jgi:PAS domain S-box-containing protein